MKKLLSREAILGADDIKKTVVEVPEWGGNVILGMMTGEARDAFEQSVNSGDGGPNIINIHERIVVLTAIDESGNRLFTEEDIVALSKKSAAAVRRCALAAQKLNALTQAAVEELKGN